MVELASGWLETFGLQDSKVLFTSSTLPAAFLWLISLWNDDGFRGFFNTISNADFRLFYLSTRVMVGSTT